MGNLNRRISLSLGALAAVFLLRPSASFADDANGLPSPPPVNNGTEGKIEDVTINGMTFKQGRQVVSSSAADSVSVDVEIYAPEGIGARLNSQRHTTIKYRWSMGPCTPPLEKDKRLLETITVKSTLENRDTGKTTTDRDDSYKVETDWEKAGTTYTLRRCDATSRWKMYTGNTGTLEKSVLYHNEPADDGNSFVSHRASRVTTDFEVVDPFWGPWTFWRESTWPLIGRPDHTVFISGVVQQNPVAWSMIEAAVVGCGMDPVLNDPSIPALSGIPLEWPQPPPFV